MVTKSTLKQYRHICKSMIDLEKRIKRKEKVVDSIEHGVVSGSLPDFPYTKAHFNLSGYNISVSGMRKETLEAEKGMYNDLVSKYEIQKLEIERFINSIDDPVTGQIFRLIFVDGLKQEAAAAAVGLERSTVSKKIDDYLKIHTNHKNS